MRLITFVLAGILGSACSSAMAWEKDSEGYVVFDDADYATANDDYTLTPMSFMKFDANELALSYSHIAVCSNFPTFPAIDTHCSNILPGKFDMRLSNGGEINFSGIRPATGYYNYGMVVYENTIQIKGGAKFREDVRGYDSSGGEIVDARFCQPTNTPMYLSRISTDTPPSVCSKNEPGELNQGTIILDALGPTSFDTYAYQMVKGIPPLLTASANNPEAFFNGAFLDEDYAPASNPDDVAYVAFIYKYDSPTYFDETTSNITYKLAITDGMMFSFKPLPSSSGMRMTVFTPLINIQPPEIIVEDR